MRERVGENHYAAERQESGEAKVRGIVAAELQRMGWTAAELKLRRKGDAGKLDIACRLRQETTVTLAWIAKRLEMGVKTHLAHLLYWRKRNEK